MGTRADFYAGRGKKAEWLGSIAWDGHPESIDNEVKQVTTAKEFRKAVAKFLKSRDDATLPRDGWPWPWDDSNTTDYAYAYESGKVWASCFGYDWFDAACPPKSKDNEDEDDPHMRGSKGRVFPNMKNIQNVTFGKRSGVIILQTGKYEDDTNVKKE